MVAGFAHAARELGEMFVFFFPGLGGFRWEVLQRRFDQRTEQLITRRDLSQGWGLVELSELRLKLGSSRREEALIDFRFPLSDFRFGTLSLVTPYRSDARKGRLSAATICARQSQPGREEPQIFQMFLAIPLESLGPPLEFFLFVR